MEGGYPSPLKVTIVTFFRDLVAPNEKSLNYLVTTSSFEIDELKIWYDEMKKNPIFSSNSGLDQIPLKILYLEIMQTISVDGFKKNFIKVVKYPLCFNKIKLIIKSIIVMKQYLLFHYHKL